MTCSWLCIYHKSLAYYGYWSVSYRIWDSPITCVNDAILRYVQSSIMQNNLWPQLYTLKQVLGKKRFMASYILWTNSGKHGKRTQALHRFLNSFQVVLLAYVERRCCRHLYTRHWKYPDQWSALRVLFHLVRHLAMSGDIFDCHKDVGKF